MSVTTISPGAAGEPVAFAAGCAIAVAAAVLVVLIVHYDLISLTGTRRCHALSS